VTDDHRSGTGAPKCSWPDCGGFYQPETGCGCHHATGTHAPSQGEAVRSQRERIEEVQQRLYDLLLADNPNETSDDDEAIVLIRQADEALSLAWKLATNA